jgi:hypothetical protein
LRLSLLVSVQISATTFSLESCATGLEEILQVIDPAFASNSPLNLLKISLSFANSKRDIADNPICPLQASPVTPKLSIDFAQIARLRHYFPIRRSLRFGSHTPGACGPKARTRVYCPPEIALCAPLRLS